ncbi:hypothetical protein HDU96_009873 [Phlyctochytrium bullatum]|nr:hypothetical protein HDU96_009873 [Phlyctochytrium bullatum]
MASGTPPAGDPPAAAAPPTTTAEPHRSSSAPLSSSSAASASASTQNTGGKRGSGSGPAKTLPMGSFMSKLTAPNPRKTSCENCRSKKLKCDGSHRLCERRRKASGSSDASAPAPNNSTPKDPPMLTFHAHIPPTTTDSTSSSSSRKRERAAAARDASPGDHLVSSWKLDARPPRTVVRWEAETTQQRRHEEEGFHPYRVAQAPREAEQAAAAAAAAHARQGPLDEMRRRPSPYLTPDVDHYHHAPPYFHPARHHHPHNHHHHHPGYPYPLPPHAYPPSHTPYPPPHPQYPPGPSRTMFKHLLSLAFLASSVTAIAVPTSLDGITSISALPIDSPDVRLVQVNKNLYLAGPNISWPVYHSAVGSVGNLFDAGLGAVIDPSNIKDLSAALRQLGFSGELWVSSFNGDNYMATKTTNCMTLNVDTAFFRVYTDPVQCKADVARPFLMAGYSGKMVIETFEVEDRLFQFLDFGVSYPIYEFIADLSKVIVPASIDSHVLPQVSKWLTKKNYKGTVWIGSWDGNTYNSTCMALTLPNTVNVYEGKTACTHLRPALYEVIRKV